MTPYGEFGKWWSQSKLTEGFKPQFVSSDFMALQLLFSWRDDPDVFNACEFPPLAPLGGVGVPCQTPKWPEKQSRLDESWDSHARQHHPASIKECAQVTNPGFRLPEIILWVLGHSLFKSYSRAYKYQLITVPQFSVSSTKYLRKHDFAIKILCKHRSLRTRRPAICLSKENTVANLWLMTDSA